MKKGTKLSEDTRRKMSESRKQYLAQNPMSEETKRKISLARRSKEVSPELILKIAEVVNRNSTNEQQDDILKRYERECKRSVETRIKMSKSRSKKLGRLNESDVKIARYLYDSGQLNVTQLSKFYKVSYSSMHDIVKRKTWRHIP